MPRQQAAVNVNAFVKGIITEAGPLTFPDNASIDELNLVLNKDGSRKRRLGMNTEPDAVSVNSGALPLDDLGMYTTSWKAPGGYTEFEFIALQTGNRVTIFDSSSKPVSAAVKATFDIGSDPTVRMSMATVDGLLVIATGQGDISSLDFNGTTVTRSTGRLKIRDMFGVADTIAGVNLLEGSGITTRPVNTTNAHTYNLRNQTFAYPRKPGTDEDLRDPVNGFKVSFGVYQSNADNLVTFLYADANDSDDRQSKRYISYDNFNNPLGTNRAPRGFFIIDAMNRGASRLSEVAKLMSEHPTLVTDVTALPVDSTPGGATVVASFAGRVFYAGFSSQVSEGDSQSPRMTSYVLFSRLVQSPSDAYKCYQAGDPTSSEIPDLVDTDGGFIRIDGAYNIQHMVNVGDSLMVIAENGVWKISGGSGYGFNATNYLTSKVTEHGSIAPSSVVVLDNTFMYWSDDGIYHVSQNQYGDWTGSNLTNSTIQSLYDDIPYLAKKRVDGIYDAYQRRVRWLYNNYLASTEPTKELVLDVTLSAFYLSSVPTLANGYPRLLSMVKVPPFVTAEETRNVVDSNGNKSTTSTGDYVVNTADVIDSSLSEIFYVTALGITSNTVSFTFSYYRDSTFTDWVSIDGVGVDAPAYLLTGWAAGGDFFRQKQVPYLTVYSYKTETGFDSDFNPVNASSIQVQSQWSWTNLASSGKWSPTFQAYRHKRFWAPSASTDAFANGEYVVTTRSKLRGRGNVLSLKMSTEPKKDFHLLGWSYIVGVNGVA